MRIWLVALLCGALFTLLPGDVQAQSLPTRIFLPTVNQGNRTFVPYAEGGQSVYGLSGQLEPAADQRLGAVLLTTDGGRYGLVGVTPEVEEMVDAARRTQPGAEVRVWGTLYPAEAGTADPLIVVTELQVAGGGGPTATVIYDVVNLRSGPGSNYPPTGQVRRGGRCRVLAGSQTGTWWYLDSCPNGLQGWMDARLVEVAGDLAEAPLLGSGGSSATPTAPLVGPAPIVVPTPAPLTTPWQAAYFNNSQLADSPLVIVQNLPEINLNWGAESPHPALPGDYFSARFERTADFDAGYYRFYARTDDGIRVWLDDFPLLAEWHGATGQTYSVGRTLAGRHRLRVEYYELTGDAGLRFWWEPVKRDLVWSASYFNGIEPGDVPAFRQMEPTGSGRPLDYAWGGASPMPGLVTEEYWSARWVGVFRFEDANYIFRTNSDDGVRLWIDDTLVIDRWQDGYTERSTRFIGVGAGEHTIRIEYYERTGPALLQAWWYKDTSRQIPE